MRRIRCLLILPIVSLSLLFNAAHAAETYGPVKSGESLWLISKDNRPAATVTINQMMIATFRKNPDAFGGNINWLYANRMLTLPDSAEATAISPADADAEVVRQNTAWSNAVDKFVAADESRQQQLSTVISGQPSDDPEIQALREELRALIAGVKEERASLQEERRKSLEEQSAQDDSFFDREAWSFSFAAGHSLISPIEDSRDRPQDNGSFQYLSYRFDSDGSLSNLGVHANRPLWGRMEGFRLTLGVEYALIAGHGEITSTFDHPTDTAGIPPGSYHQRFRRDADVSLLRLPVLLDTVVWVWPGKTELVVGGGVVINRTLNVDHTFRDELTDLDTGVTTVESGPSHPLYDDVTSEGLSYDLRLLTGLRWTPEWTGNRPVWAGLELDQSLGDPFGGTDVAHNLIRFEKTRFQLKLGIDF